MTGVGMMACLVGLIVERDIAGDDRTIKGKGGISQSLNGLRQLRHDVRVFGIAKIEVVGECQRARAHRTQIAITLGRSQSRAVPRVKSRGARVRITGEGYGPAVVVNADDCRIASRCLHGIGHDMTIILFKNPAATGGVMTAKHGCEIFLNEMRVIFDFEMMVARHGRR